MTEQQAYLTPEGLTKLQAELEHLETVRRREVADALKSAAEVGSTVDNAEYDEAKREQDTMERRILTLENLLQVAVVIPSRKRPSGVVEVGSRVVVVEEKGARAEYTIVGSAEADPLHGRISNESPVGRAILGKRVGERVEVRTPAGVVKLTVRRIQ